MEWSNPLDQKKQDILDALQKEHPSSIPTFKAMDQFAKQQAIAFSTYLMNDYKMSLHPESPILTDEEIYDKFLKTNNQ